VKHKLLTRAEYRYVEDILFRMEHIEREYERARADILHGTKQLDADMPMVVGGATTSRTESAALRLISSPRLELLERELKAFQVAMKRLDQENADLYEWYYRRGYGRVACQEKGCYEKSTFYKLRKHLIYTVANELGLCMY